MIHNDFLPNIQHDLTEPGGVGRVQSRDGTGQDLLLNISIKDHQSDESRFCTLSPFSKSVCRWFQPFQLRCSSGPASATEFLFGAPAAHHPAQARP